MLLPFYASFKQKSLNLTLGLQPAYRLNEDVSKFVRQTVALPFVPHRFIHLAWHAIKVTASTPATDIKRWMNLWLSWRRLGCTLALEFGTYHFNLMPAAPGPTTTSRPRMAQVLFLFCTIPLLNKLVQLFNCFTLFMHEAGEMAPSGNSL